MPGQVAAIYTSFGRNEYLRSTRGCQFESYTVAATSIPADAFGNKVLQSGTVMARITSASGTSQAADVGKIGPFWRGAVSNEVQTINLGAASAGTVTITWDGATTGSINYNASNATIQAALEALPNVLPGEIVVAGGPWPSTNVTLTWGGRYAGQDVAQITATPTGLTGGAVTIATSTAGGAAATGASDGRQTAANIVGVCDTFLPYQLGGGLSGTVQAVAMDQQVSVLKSGRVVGAACYEYLSTEVAPGTRGLSTATIRDLSTRGTDLDITVF